MNFSPWIQQLSTTNYAPIFGEHETDVLIIGGGIAGIMTATKILQMTNLKVTVIDGDQIAHGATGHNAGQVTAYIEKAFEHVVGEFGIDEAVKMQQDILQMISELEDHIEIIGGGVPFDRVVGYTGFSVYEQCIRLLRTKKLLADGGLISDKIVISSDCPWKQDIPDLYQSYFEISDHQHILNQLETKNTHYQGYQTRAAGATNSALLCHKTVEYLMKKYPDRLTIAEWTHMDTLNVYDSYQVSTCSTLTGKSQIISKIVVLCTNGFTNFTINHHVGGKIVHNDVIPTVGFMGGYLLDEKTNPTAISYHFDPKEFHLSEGSGVEDYFYMTRRSYQLGGREFSLVCLGGPVEYKKFGYEYTRRTTSPDEKHQDIDLFIRTAFREHPVEPIRYHFRRHGLMGYTNNTLRKIGPSPVNANVMFNLGCNGVGILPSILGAIRVAQHLANIPVERSVFDVR